MLFVELFGLIGVMVENRLSLIGIVNLLGPCELRFRLILLLYNRFFIGLD